MTEYRYITDDYEAQKAVAQLQDVRCFSFDCETTSLDPYLGRLRLLQIAPGPNFAYIFDHFKLGRAGKLALKRLMEDSKAVKLAHNGKFDIKWLRAQLGVRWVDGLVDTMLAHMLTACGNIEGGGFGLQASAWEFLRVQLDKAEQTSDWGRANLTEEQLQYGARDACVLHDLWPEIRKKLLAQEQMNVALIEFECVDAMANLELNGLLLDRERWLALHREVVADWKVARRELQDLLMVQVAQVQAQQALFAAAPGHLINPNSTDQLIPALLRMSVPLPIDDETGHYTTRNFRIEPLAHDYYVIKVLLEYRALQKMKSSYGLTWLEFINPWTGRIHASFHQIGAGTGRMACSDPNVQQVPVRNPKFGPIFRKCFVAGPGNLMVGGDYSQFELRILADYCRDPGMLKAFTEGLDYHEFTAQQIFRVEKPDFFQRRQAKNNNFANVYGAGPSRFALMAGISFELAKQVMGQDREAFPVKHRWLDAQARHAVTKGFSKTRSGRIWRYLFDPDNKKDVALVERNGKNTPIQGTNADATKRAMKLLNDRLKGQNEIKLIHVVHDELNCEAPASLARDFEPELHKIMLKAGEEFVRAVPVKVDTRVGYEWSK